LVIGKKESPGSDMRGFLFCLCVGLPAAATLGPAAAAGDYGEEHDKKGDSDEQHAGAGRSAKEKITREAGGWLAKSLFQGTLALTGGTAYAILSECRREKNPCSNLVTWLSILPKGLG
jgi:hypothetical protein